MKMQVLLPSAIASAINHNPYQTGQLSVRLPTGIRTIISAIIWLFSSLTKFIEGMCSSITNTCTGALGRYRESNYFSSSYTFFGSTPLVFAKHNHGYLTNNTPPSS